MLWRKRSITVKDAVITETLKVGTLNIHMRFEILIIP